MGPNGLRKGHSQVSQSHFGEVTAAGCGTGTVRTPQPGRPYTQKIAIRPVNLAQQVADAR